MKLPQSKPQERQIKYCQRQKYNRHRQVRELWHQRSTQALAGVYERIDQDNFLEDWKVIERAPRLIGASEKNHWRQNHAEHQANVGLTNAATESQSAAG